MAGWFDANMPTVQAGLMADPNNPGYALNGQPLRQLTGNRYTTDSPRQYPTDAASPRQGPGTTPTQGQTTTPVTGTATSQPDGSQVPDWAKQPAPKGFVGPWPPPLPPGASYGPNPGQINYGPGGITSTTTTTGPGGSTVNPDLSVTPPPATKTGGGVDPNNPLFQGIRPDLVKYFIDHGITPTARGTGKTDIAYLNDKMNEPGQDPGYWLNEKLPNQVFGSGGGGGGGGGGGLPSAMAIGSGANQYGNFGIAPAPYTPQPFTGNIFQPQAFQGTPYQPAPFQAPTGLDYTNDPGYQARLQMGEQAIQNSAAARGSILSGGTLKALERYGQDYGSSEFQNVYGRALGTYNTNVNAGQLGFGNQLTALGQQNQAGQLGFQNRYGDYLNQQGMNFQANQANIGNQRNAQLDYWSMLNNLNQQGQNAASTSYQTV